MYAIRENLFESIEWARANVAEDNTQGPQGKRLEGFLRAFVLCGCVTRHGASNSLR